MNRYALITVDTEALPNRAETDHVRRPIWGRTCQWYGRCARDVRRRQRVRHQACLFVDMCGAYARRDEVEEVVRCLDRDGQDVEMHAHPEYLLADFWPEFHFNYRPRFMNQYADDKDDFVIDYFWQHACRHPRQASAGIPRRLLSLECRDPPRAGKAQHPPFLQQLHVRGQQPAVSAQSAHQCPLPLGKRRGGDPHVGKNISCPACKKKKLVGQAAVPAVQILPLPSVVGLFPAGQRQPSDTVHGLSAALLVADVLGRERSRYLQGRRAHRRLS